MKLGKILIVLTNNYPISLKINKCMALVICEEPISILMRVLFKVFQRVSPFWMGLFYLCHFSGFNETFKILCHKLVVDI